MTDPNIREIAARIRASDTARATAEHVLRSARYDLPLRDAAALLEHVDHIELRTQRRGGQRRVIASWRIGRWAGGEHRRDTATLALGEALQAIAQALVERRRR